jgi:hypothetical protein
MPVQTLNDGTERARRSKTPLVLTIIYVVVVTVAFIVNRRTSDPEGAFVGEIILSLPCGFISGLLGLTGWYWYAVTFALNSAGVYAVSTWIVAWTSGKDSKLN